MSPLRFVQTVAGRIQPSTPETFRFTDTPVVGRMGSPQQRRTWSEGTHGQGLMISISDLHEAQ